MEDYLETVITDRINLHPRDLGPGFEKRIINKIRSKYENKIIPLYGYIKPGSTQLLSRTQGKIDGCHFTGNVTYTVEFRALVLRIAKGQKISCTISDINKYGIVAPVPPNAVVFIPLYNNPNIGDLAPWDQIIVSVEDFRLLPPNKERRKSQYMIIGTFLSKKDGSTVRTMNVEIGVSCELLNTIEEGTYDAIDRAHADEVSVEKILKLKKTIYTMNDDYNRIKDPISAVHGGFGNDFWGRFLKFFVYDYELVFAQEQYLRLMASVTNTDATTLLATYRPKNIISRAYFKLHEILNTTHGNDDKTLISRLPNNPNILSIGEAPGGFIQCILHHLKESASLNLYGISITTANAHVSSTWGKLISLLEEEDGHYNITTKYGGQPNESNQNVTLIDADLTVDATLTDLLNSLGLPEPRNHDDNDDNDDDDDEGSPVNAGGKGMDLITADGYVIPDNLDYEEMSMYTLLFTETVYALLTQARGGSFVIKLYDIFTDFTVKLITYISQYYDKVYLTKPMSSRIANSEKYLVCTGFRGFPTEKRQQILKVWRKFMDVENSTDKSVEIGKQQHIIDVFDTVEEYEADSISLYNNVYLNEQIQAFLFAGEQFKAYITSDKDQLENRLSSRFKNQMEHYEQWRKDFNYHPHQHQ